MRPILEQNQVVGITAGTPDWLVPVKRGDSGECSHGGGTW